MNNEKSVVIEIFKKQKTAIVNCQEKEVGIETRKQLGVARNFIGNNSKNIDEKTGEERIDKFPKITSVFCRCQVAPKEETA